VARISEEAYKNLGRNDLMPSLWSNEDAHADLGYRNIKAAELAAEREIRDALDEMWAVFEPFADADFVPAFAHDPDARFWELFLGYSLLQDGRQLLSAEERGRREGLPDICVVDGDSRTWIEAIAPSLGAAGPDQIVPPIPLDQGGVVIGAPERQVHLRITSALYTKSVTFQRYMERGVVHADDVRLVAVGASRWGRLASDRPPSALHAVFPVGDQFARCNLDTGEAIEEGFQTSWTIPRQNGDIERTAFLGDEYTHISGLVWSRAGIGNYHRQQRPISLIHNPVAQVQPIAGWTAWDREYVGTRDGENWTIQDERAVEV